MKNMTKPGRGLIADIGATNARFALADDQGVHDPLTLQCADYQSLSEAADSYLKKTGVKTRPSSAALAVAAPVNGNDVAFTNNPWAFSIPQIQKELDVSHLKVMNDFEAIARGVPYLGNADIKKTGDGQVVPGHCIGVIGPGTGLGVASLFWDGAQFRPNACEGGHVTMPARTQREFDIFRTLRYKYSHVSAERVCSGKGLVNIYNAIRILDGHDAMGERTAEDISAAALSKACPVCSESLNLMMRLLGRVAGDLALTLNARGGIYIAGGIPAKLGDYFFNSEFRAEFINKGRYEDYLREIPTFLITHPNIAFVGLQHVIMQDMAASA